jgi:hypothetical protein
MSKYLVLWEFDRDRLPEQTEKRGAILSNFIDMVKQYQSKGLVKDWGMYIGEGKGYAVLEGDETEISIILHRYGPYVRFKTRPIMSGDKLEDMLKRISKGI